MALCNAAGWRSQLLIPKPDEAVSNVHYYRLDFPQPLVGKRMKYLLATFFSEEGEFGVYLVGLARLKDETKGLRYVYIAVYPDVEGVETSLAVIRTFGRLIPIPKREIRLEMLIGQSGVEYCYRVMLYENEDVEDVQGFLETITGIAWVGGSPWHIDIVQDDNPERYENVLGQLSKIGTIIPVVL